jgi:23S rRNA (uracil1939-C5)-methyltransferase
MERCEILPSTISALLRPLRDLIGDLTVREAIPQIELAVGEGLASMVIRNLDPLSDEDASALRSFGRENGIAFFLQPGGIDTIAPLVPEEAPQLSYSLPAWDLSIEFGPVDFIQVNPQVNRVLVQRILDVLDPQPGERIADLFCGLGNFSLPLAKCGARVTGFELIEAQVERARHNARSNGLAGMADFVMRDLYSTSDGAAVFLEDFDKMLLDPPRSGAKEVVGAVSRQGPRRIVYVSCNPETLARDAAVLVNEKGFALEACGIVNMFPHTLHAEAIAVFEKGQ